eukprot:TRINITY_DN9501_c0_g1_i1.p1 TRINITY_DN9501_c0_g1~~TRINITY_DN9501_c0_g1_i1.p1  ORF type:complete len:116 (+),score=12.26 TRINITY_DN9501_c0_g1_i1:120-467(+)
MHSGTEHTTSFGTNGSVTRIYKTQSTYQKAKAQTTTQQEHMYCNVGAKRHDYFTSALPWPTKKDLVLKIPPGDSIDIVSTGALQFNVGGTDTTTLKKVLENRHGRSSETAEAHRG